jgi:hypothetical protein
MATYPYTQQALLVNSISTTTVISLVSGMQVANITFNNPSGLLGVITLSPVQPVATNVQFQSGQQVLKITTATFRAAFGLDAGQVTVSGDATDQNGHDDNAFNKQIASWS